MGAQKKRRQHYFVARELQASIAILVIFALLGGTFLLYLSKQLNNFFGITTPYLTIFLMLGYSTIILLSAMVFTHRLLGPFKRLEHEIKLIAKGTLDKRLSIRTKDDWHVANFISSVNKLIERFEQKSFEYNRLNAKVSERLDQLMKKIKDDEPCEDIIKLIKILQKDIENLQEEG